MRGVTRFHLLLLLSARDALRRECAGNEPASLRQRRSPRRRLPTHLAACSSRLRASSRSAVDSPASTETRRASSAIRICRDGLLFTDVRYAWRRAIG